MNLPDRPEDLTAEIAVEFFDELKRRCLQSHLRRERPVLGGPRDPCVCGHPARGVAVGRECGLLYALLVSDVEEFWLATAKELDALLKESIGD